MASKLQKKPFIVPVFIPHAGCPHRCLFCDQTRTTGLDKSIPSTTEIDAAITQFLAYRKRGDQKTEISFYGGNFLGLPSAQIQKLLGIADGYIRQGHVHGIRFSTRPDTIDLDRLALIRDFPISTIELGVQSMNDKVLAKSRRGNTAEDTHSAVALLKKEDRHIGLQMMVGLPGDTPQTAFESGRQIAALGPDFVRIYPCLVLESSPLARRFVRGRFIPLSLKQAVDQVKSLYIHFAKSKIPVIRMGLQPTADLNANSGIIAGPFHPAFGDLVHSAIWLAALQKSLACLDLNSRQAKICVHPSQVSRVYGHQRRNISQLKTHFGLKTIEIRTDTSLASDTAIVNGRSLNLF